jgi:hypothetical protein
MATGVQVRPNLVHQPTHGGQHVVEIEWFRYYGPGSRGRGGGELLGAGTDRYHGDPVSMRGHVIQHAHSVHSRQPQIEQYHDRLGRVPNVAVYCSDRFEAIKRLQYSVTFLLQRVSEQVTNRRIVVDDEHQRTARMHAISPTG